VLLARNNQTNFLDGLKLIDLSGEGLGAKGEEGEASIEELAWLTDLDQATPHQRPAQKDTAAEAIDQLLATYWP
ncbi:MAG: hypothetical protein HQ567_04025, partial [Candidatus Nealsonbacteria bacterium]|nr:hypothetical protein [Candidatus Nealsonbacteria bacterium]